MGRRIGPSLSRCTEGGNGRLPMPGDRQFLHEPLAGLTGRTEQFATRLRADTIEAIYTYADHHEITLVETIERAIAALIDAGR